MVNCVQCGSEVEPGIIVCPYCGQNVAQEVPDTGEPPDMALDASVPGSTMPPERGGPLPEGWTVKDLTTMRQLDSSIPGQEIPPSHGGGFHQGQGDDAEPPEGLTDTKRLDMPYGEVPDRDLSAEGPRGGPPGKPTWLPYAIVAIIVILAAILGGLYLLGDGDDNGNGDGKADLVIDREMTEGYYVYEPMPGYSLVGVVKNVGDDAVNMAGLELHVALYVNDQMRGSDTRPLSGSLEASGTISREFQFETAFDPGDTIRVTVILRDSSSQDAVDSYTINQTVAI